MNLDTDQTANGVKYIAETSIQVQSNVANTSQTSGVDNINVQNGVEPNDTQGVKPDILNKQEARKWKVQDETMNGNNRNKTEH